MGTGVCFPKGKPVGREADHSPPSTAEVKSAWRYSSTPPYVFMAWWLLSTEAERLYPAETHLARTSSLQDTDLGRDRFLPNPFQFGIY
jgi:hypothetical protein